MEGGAEGFFKGRAPTGDGFLDEEDAFVSVGSVRTFGEEVDESQACIKDLFKYLDLASSVSAILFSAIFRAQTVILVSVELGKRRFLSSYERLGKDSSASKVITSESILIHFRQRVKCINHLATMWLRPEVYGYIPKVYERKGIIWMLISYLFKGLND